MSHQALKLGLL